MKRWIIRSFFIGILTLCLGGWVWSGMYDIRLFHKEDIDHAMVYQTSQGALEISSGTVAPEIPDGWSFDVSRQRDVHFWPPMHDPERFPFPHYFLGFRLHIEAALIWVSMPSWFLTLFFCSVLILVWRKTQPKAKGFPVEVQTSKAK